MKYLRMILILLILGFDSEAAKVAIVGGGISGCSSAYFLKEFGTDFDIHIFEKNSTLGGRELTIEFEGLSLDVGATAIFSKNYYLIDFLQKFNISKDNSDDSTGVIGIWSGSDFHFLSPDDFRLPANVVKTYGLWTLKLFPHVKKVLNDFLQVYNLQENGSFWESPDDMAKALGIYNLTMTSSYQHFDKLGMEKNFVLDFIDGASRDNYNQNGSINAFAGAGIGGSVFTLLKGTQQLPKNLAHDSAATLHMGETVQSIIKTSNGGFNLLTEKQTFSADAVIFASPAENSNISLENLPSLTRCDRKYQKVFVTFVAGNIDASYFGNPKRTPLTNILTVSKSTSPFTTIGYHGRTASGDRVYKLFSLQAMQDEDLSAIFDSMRVIYRHVWDAYPVLTPSACWPPFVPVDNFVYVNAMESIASSMETEIISAKNAALYIRSRFSKINL